MIRARSVGVAGLIWCLFQCGAAWSNPGIRFIENKNQWDRSIDFGAKVPGGNLFVGANGFHFYLFDQSQINAHHEGSHSQNEIPDASLHPDRIQGHYVNIEWSGGRMSDPKPYGVHNSYYNFFLSADRTRHASNAHSYEGVMYGNIYDGIDLRIYSLGSDVKYDFIVAPGADVNQITNSYKGAQSLSIDAEGNLSIETSVGELIEQRPYAYQVINGKRLSVPCQYMLDGDRLSYAFPEGYDACEVLVIDPLLIFSTYSGFTADNWGSTATPGEHGMLYSSGVTNPPNFGGTFPVNPGAFQTAHGGLYDVGILKYDSLGQQLLYSSFLGGSEGDSPHSLVMDSNGDLLVLGTTSSSNFPVTPNAMDQSYGGGTYAGNVIQYNFGSDIFIARISSDGTQLKAATYVGGSSNDGLNPTGGPLTRNYGDELRGDIITDASGYVYISSVTSSTDLLLVNSATTVFKGGATDGLLMKLSADLSQMEWGMFLGGQGADASHTLKIDGNGDIFIAGGTDSPDFPVTSGAMQSVSGGEVDGWIAHVAGDGQSLLAATFTGTTAYDQIYFIDINEAEDVFVYGQTTGGNDFPITPGVYHNPNSGQFVQKLSNDLSTLMFSTVFGSGRGIPDISPTAFLVNECNNLYMTGWGGIVNSQNGHWNNNTLGMPLTPDAFQSTTSGSDFYFMVLTDDASEFLYGTYMGGNFSRTHVDGGTSRFDKGGIVYHAVCSGCAAFNGSPTGNSTSDFPTTAGAWSRVNRSLNCNNAAFKFDLSSLRARLQTNSTKFDMPGLQFVCLPDSIVFQNKSVGGEMFQWDMGDGTFNVKNDTTFVLHKYQQPGRYTVKLLAIDPGTCQVTDQTEVTVDVFVRAGRVQDDDAMCDGDSYTLDASGGVQYEWRSDDPEFSSTSSKPVVAPDTTTRYWVTITETNGCVMQDSVTLRVVPGIEPDFELTMDGVCLERPSIKVRDLTEDAQDATMTFYFGDGSDSDLPDTDHAYEKDDVYRVTLSGTREFCVYEKEQSVPVYSIKIPNVITPGLDDGVNDFFDIRFSDEGTLRPADFDLPVSLSVYNRWGALVFYDDDYQYDWSAEGLAAGIYYYEVVVQGRSTCKSWVHVMK